MSEFVIIIRDISFCGMDKNADVTRQVRNGTAAQRNLALDRRLSTSLTVLKHFCDDASARSHPNDVRSGILNLNEVGSGKQLQVLQLLAKSVI